tara:strand:- start:174 stop:1475 length:1302 start_codon:yes stop_codon:yes gene_type:complete
METIVAKRELGEGRWDKALKRKMTELSVSDDYNIAKHEWIATGEVWWSGNDEMPDWVANSEMGAGKCLCGHIVVYHFQIENTENGRIECVGSDHINTYLIMRAIAEDLGMPTDNITDEQIQEWIDVRTKSMKAEAWWKSNGTGFEMMFDGVKEIDLHFNIRTGEDYYDHETERWMTKRVLRKRGDGKYGSSDYKMASVVWRWNHPDNPKAQINTTGFPNDNLMKDLSLLYITRQAKVDILNEYKASKEKRIAQIAERKRLEAERREQRRIQREAEEAERLRIHNLPENVEKRRLEAEALAERRKQQRLINEQLTREREERQRLKDIVKANQEVETLTKNNEEFENLCGYYGVPVFDASFAGNDWEREFLASIKKQMLKDKPMSERQLSALKRIMETDGATVKQLNYLRALNYDGDMHTLSKREASRLINELQE